MPSSRKCDNCGIRMPFGKSRLRDADGRLLCNGCHPDGAGAGEGRPLGHHGALACENCGAEATTEGMQIVAGRFVCPSGCKTAADEQCPSRKPDSPRTMCYLEKGHEGQHEGREADERKGRGTVRWSMLSARVAHVDDPIRVLAMRFVAHDSGDGKTIYHCPFCGGGGVVKGSDGVTECSFCHAHFTVQVQPEYSAMPQTNPLTGEPLSMPGMPGQRSDPNDALTDGTVDGGSEVFEPEGAVAPPFDPGVAPAVPPIAAMLVNASGVAMPIEAYQRHLAIKFADDRVGVINDIRAERGVR